MYDLEDKQIIMIIMIIVIIMITMIIMIAMITMITMITMIIMIIMIIMIRCMAASYSIQCLFITLLALFSLCPSRMVTSYQKCPNFQRLSSKRSNAEDFLLLLSVFTWCAQLMISYPHDYPCIM